MSWFVLSFLGGSSTDLGSGAVPPDCPFGSRWRHRQRFSWLQDYAVSRQTWSGQDRGSLHVVCRRWVKARNPWYETECTCIYLVQSECHVLFVLQCAISQRWPCLVWSTWPCSCGPWFCIGMCEEKGQCNSFYSLFFLFFYSLPKS